jgi:5-phospho-D-xylono-1,4-lactonase
MSFIRTVLGDIEPAGLGACGAHEHVFIRPGFPTFVQGELLLDDVEKITAELTAFRAAGGGALVDTMPCDAGRDVLSLAEISRRSGVHIVVPTGLHLPAYYPPGHWGDVLGEEELAQLFTRDITEGIDSLDYSGPVVRRTPHRAGVIKVASGREGMGERERKVFSAAARASRETGAPIITHTEQGLAGPEQAAFLRSAGVDLSHLVISHTDKITDADYHRRILDTGACVEYDSPIRFAGRAENPGIDLLAKMLPEYPGQVMAGMDAAKRKYWRSYGGTPGITYLVRELREELARRGVGEALVRALLVDNPARAYAFRSR